MWSRFKSFISKQLLMRSVSRITGYVSALDAAFTSLLYSGEQTDRSGMQYLRARFYDPRRGRFDRLDPFAGNLGDPQSLHKYLYASASPIDLFDPTGYAPDPVGHHWIPRQIISWLERQGYIDEEEALYMTGRSSGPLSDRHVYDAEHRVYNSIVREQSRLWAEGGKKQSIEQFVNYIRSGKSFDGERQITELYDYNVRTIMADMLNPNYDIVAKGEIMRRGGIIRRLRPTKLLFFIGAVGAAAQIANAAGQANDVATVLTEGEGIKDAIKFAKQGKDVSLRIALTGMGGPRKSTYEELLEINPIFAAVFRKTVELGFEQELGSK